MNIVWTIINLIIFFLLIKKFLFKPVLKIMEEREKMIQDQFDQAEAVNAEAMEQKEKYEEALKGAKDDSITILEQARERAQAESDQIVKDAKERADKITLQAQENLENDRERAMEEVQSQIATLAVSAAAKILGDVSNGQTDEEMYRQFLQKAGEGIDANGN
jgi:F-type H+-transporting ATPase subunit b